MFVRFSHGVALTAPPLSFLYFLEGSHCIQPTCKVGELGSISWAEGQEEVCTCMIWCSACEICPSLFVYLFILFILFRSVELVDIYFVL